MREHLDLSAVEAFLLISDLRSFTRAAEALGITQAGVSIKMRRLETSLGRRLLNRTPRQVRLSMDGDAFLPHARALLAAQNIALNPPDMRARRLSLGICDHVAGPELPAILVKMKAYDPGLEVQVRVAASKSLIKAFDCGDIDIAIIRRQGRRRDDEVLFHDSYGWFGSSSIALPFSPVRLVTVDDACGVRAIAIRLLSQAKIEWVDTFIGGGVATALSAVIGGVGIAPLPTRLATVELTEVSEIFSLPPFPTAEVAMLANTIDVQTKLTLRMLMDAFRSCTD